MFSFKTYTDKFDLNQQNKLDNIILHYSIKLIDEYPINGLCYVDKELKNNQEKSLMDILIEIKN
ncbi:hypothetical protein BCR32DRAFT_282103 [Anaeromyces robustus]|uniref:Uncharacterized protein n=1 Tax=Anaeromyces robustus TaxID=1754192 RepID=A0A1Y1WYR1_9FUNG|nr:hypothetical protein BCR32DRAFT_282103 [Anaeromyces robustus]|eukprot:ORX78643.1 hypothetical protein BCR32DRAFT_282103 [Anaeromyces robustus]